MMRDDGMGAPREVASAAQGELFLRIVRWVLPLGWLAVLAVTLATFFSLRSPWDLAWRDEPRAFGMTFFPLAGLIAFVLVWTQTIIGANLWWLRRAFPAVLRFHRTQGVFALLFAFVHPLLLLVGVGLSSYLARNYVAKELLPFVWIGYVQLAFLVLTTGTALLRRLPLVQKFWRTLHLANYAVFALAWVHSWFLGTDVQPTGLRFVWLFFAITAVMSVVGRLFAARRRNAERRQPTAGEPPQGFTAVGALADFADERPSCVAVGAAKAVLVRRGTRVDALDNVCTHAGGPLCEGAYRNGTIGCPWHASSFRLEDGAVVAGPARRAQPRYESRVQNGIVYLKPSVFPTGRHTDADPSPAMRRDSG